MKITIFGKGSMGKAIGDNFDACGNEVEYAGREFIGELGDIIVLAVPYTAVDGILRKWGPKMKDKVLIDITNPVDFETMDHMLVPDGTSTAELIQGKAPGAFVVKAFNTNFANTLATGKVGFYEQTVVLMASDFLNAKDKVAEALTGCRLKLMDAGKRNGSYGLPADFPGFCRKAAMDKRLCNHRLIRGLISSAGQCTLAGHGGGTEHANIQPLHHCCPYAVLYRTVSG